MNVAPRNEAVPVNLPGLAKFGEGLFDASSGDHLALMSQPVEHVTPANMSSVDPPSSSAAPLAAAKPLPVRGLALASELRVLLVDESSADRFLLRTALQRAGTAHYQIVECADANIAVEAARTTNPDVIVLDYRLTGHDGVQLAQELAKLVPDAAFLIVTRQGDEAAAVRAMKAGASDYLVKDQVLYDPVRIDRAVQAAVYTKTLERENQRILETLQLRNLELEALNRKLWELSHTDELTGYFNRRYISSRLDEEIARSIRYKIPLSIVLADLDHFKRINDTYGHLAGDRALQSVAHLIRSALRDTDLIGRFGGEEFLLILTNTDIVGATNFCHRLCERIEHHPICIGETVLCLTASFGVASLSESCRTAPDLIRAADQNLYRAKAEGRNRVVASAALASMDTVLENWDESGF